MGASKRRNAGTAACTPASTPDVIEMKNVTASSSPGSFEENTTRPTCGPGERELVFTMRSPATMSPGHTAPVGGSYETHEIGLPFKSSTDVTYWIASALVASMSTGYETT